MDPLPMPAFERRQKRKSGIGGLLSSVVGFIPGQLLGKAVDEGTSVGKKLTNPYGNPGILGKAIGAAGGASDFNMRTLAPAVGASMAMKLGGQALGSALEGAGAGGGSLLGNKGIFKNGAHSIFGSPPPELSDTSAALQDMSGSYQPTGLQQPNYGSAMLRKQKKYGFLG